MTSIQQAPVSMAPVTTSENTVKLTVETRAAIRAELAKAGRKYPASLLCDLSEKAEAAFSKWCAANDVPGEVKSLVNDWVLIHTCAYQVAFGGLRDDDAADLPDTIASIAANTEEVNDLG
jgi:hypothetical protein